MPVTASPSLLMQQLQAQFEQFVLGGGAGWDLTVVSAQVLPADRGAGTGWCVRVRTHDGMTFEVALDPEVDDVRTFFSELAALPARPPAPDGERPSGLVLH